MKQYPNVIHKLFYEPLIVTREHHQAICKVLESHIAKVEEAEAAQDGPNPDDRIRASQLRNYSTAGSTAIIPVHGTLVGHASDIPMSSCGAGCDMISDMIDFAIADPSVNRLVFDMRTPGGSVTGTPELAQKIASIVSKETIAFTDSMCCSAGMWLASQCQYFFSTESARVGSIGVWCAYLDASKALKKDGMRVQEFFAGKYKTMGAQWRALTAEESAMIQARVDKIYAQFKEAMNSRREIMDEFMQGQIFDGPEAVDAGMVDDLVESLADIVDSVDTPK